MARFCTSCGAEAAPEDRFCGSCGAALRTTPTSSPSDSSRPATGTGQAGGEPPGRERNGRDGSPTGAADAPGDQHRDIFISYAEEDLTWAEWIGWHLEEATFRVVLQAWDSVAGRNWVADLDDGIQNTDYMVVVASGAYFSSPRTRPQWTAVVAGGRIPIIPVRVEDVWIPGLLAPLTPITLAGKDEQNARAELLAQMRNVLQGRAKPADQPPIPARERAVPTKPTYPPVILIAGMGQDSTADETSATPDDSADSGSPGGDGPVGPDITSSDPATVAGNGASGSTLRSLWNRPRIRAAVGGVAAVAVAGAVATATVLPGSDDPGAAGQLTSGQAPATASGQPATPAVLALPTRYISGSHNGGGTDPVFAPDGRTIAVGHTQDEGDPTSGTGGIYLVDSTKPAQPSILGEPLTVPGDQVESVAFSPDGHTLAIGSWEGKVALWDVSNTTQPRSVGQVSTGFFARTVAFSPDGRTLAAGDDGGEIYLWDVTSPADPSPLGPPLTGPPGLVMSVAFSPDGRTLAAGTDCGCTDDDGEVFLWNVTDPGQPTLLGQPLTASLAGTSYVSSVAFSPDGRTLAAAGYSNGQIVLWDVTDPASPALLGAPLTMPHGGATSVAFSPDGHSLAGADQTDVYLWDVTHPASPSPLAAPTDSANIDANAVAFSPDGHTLASTTYNDELYLWTLP